MDKGSIRIIKTIVHILDSTTGTPVLSDKELEFGSDFSEFLQEHIWKIYTCDDAKNCSFNQDESELFPLVQGIDENNFIETSKSIALQLYGIMNSNIDIPPADLIVTVFESSQSLYLGLLKMNYKTSYTHRTGKDEDNEKINEIFMHKALLPAKSQRISEAVIVNLDDMSIRMVEKKYDVNGTKTNYLSKMFVNCHTTLSQKAKLDIVTKAVTKVAKENYSDSEQFEVNMRAKNIIHNEMVEQGEIDVPAVVEKIFEDKPQLMVEFNEKVEKYKVIDEPIKPSNETTMKKYHKQFLKTDTGIEIKIPMQEYENKDSVEFITNEDGTISVLIKNVEKIVSK